MAEAAQGMGVNKKGIILENRAKDTESQAIEIKKITKGDRFILVTSASHMPRSMMLFEKLGLKPVPAPTDYLLKQSSRMTPGAFFPSPGAVFRAHRVVYEHLGMAWARIRGKI